MLKLFLMFPILFLVFSSSPTHLQMWWISLQLDKTGPWETYLFPPQPSNIKLKRMKWKLGHKYTDFETKPCSLVLKGGFKIPPPKNHCIATTFLSHFCCHFWCFFIESHPEKKLNIYIHAIFYIFDISSLN